MVRYRQSRVALSGNTPLKKLRTFAKTRINCQMQLAKSTLERISIPASSPRCCSARSRKVRQDQEVRPCHQRRPLKQNSLSKKNSLLLLIHRGDLIHRGKMPFTGSPALPLVCSMCRWQSSVSQAKTNFGLIPAGAPAFPLRLAWRTFPAPLNSFPNCFPRKP
jgi:hypothetical protein